MRAVALALMMFGLVGCAESYEPAVLAELCGAAGPVRVLELAPDQAMSGGPWSFGDRVYYKVGRPQPMQFLPLTTFTDESLWSTGPCGESPRRIADGIFLPFELERWPGRLFACHEESGDILLLDPDGAAPRVVYAGVDCGVRWTEHGLVSVTDPAEVSGTLLLHPYPEDPGDGGPEPIVLVDELLHAGRIRNTADAIRVVSPEGELLRVDLEDLSVTIEQTDVRDFAVSEDGRYLLWRSLTTLGGDAENPIGAVTLRDQVAGVGVSLGSSDQPAGGGNLRWADRGLLVVSVGYSQRIYFLADLSFIDVHQRIDFSGPLDDDRWLLTSSFSEPWLHILDLADGTVTPLFAGRGQIRERNSQDALVLDVPSCCLDNDGRAEGSLWSVPYDGSQARRLSARATTLSYRPDPTRLLTALDIGDDNVGRLALFDLASGDERSIDDHVYFSFSLPRSGSDPGLITYSVVDGARSGVWRARLPPAP